MKQGWLITPQLPNWESELHLVPVIFPSTRAHHSTATAAAAAALPALSTQQLYLHKGQTGCLIQSSCLKEHQQSVGNFWHTKETHLYQRGEKVWTKEDKTANEDQIQVMLYLPSSDIQLPHNFHISQSSHSLPSRTYSIRWARLLYINTIISSSFILKVKGRNDI